MGAVDLYPLLRAAQSYAPFTRHVKFDLYVYLIRRFGLKIDQEFRLLSHLDRVDLAVDVGGNWGQSIEALRRTCRPAKIISFEPNPYLGRVLSSRYGDRPEITIRENALSDQPGVQKLYIPRYRGFVYDGLASLDQASALEWLNMESVAGFDPTKLELEQYQVEMTTLDSLNLRPDVVKIDVQGHELQVLKGARKTYEYQPVTIVETPSKAVVDILDDYGLTPFKYRAGRLMRGDATGLNTVFLGARDQQRLGALIAC